MYAFYVFKAKLKLLEFQENPWEYSKFEVETIITDITEVGEALLYKKGFALKFPKVDSLFHSKISVS